MKAIYPLVSEGQKTSQRKKNATGEVRQWQENLLPE